MFINKFKKKIIVLITSQIISKYLFDHLQDILDIDYLTFTLPLKNSRKKYTEANHFHIN